MEAFGTKKIFNKWRLLVLSSLIKKPHKKTEIKIPGIPTNQTNEGTPAIRYRKSPISANRKKSNN
jgi:hypothetical protein